MSVVNDRFASTPSTGKSVYAFVCRYIPCLYGFVWVCILYLNNEQIYLVNKQVDV